MNKEYISVAEIVSVTNKPKSTIAGRAKRESWPYIEQGVRGGKMRLYNFLNLPADIQQAILRKQKAEQKKAEIQKQEAAVDLPVKPGDLRGWQRDMAIARIAVCDTVLRLEFDQDMSKEDAINYVIALSRQEIRIKSDEEKTEEDYLREKVHRLAKTANARKGKNRTLSRTSIFRWLKEYSEKGSRVVNLAPKEREQQKIPAWALPFCKLYSQPQKPSIAACVEKLPNFLPEDVDPPSYSAVRRFIDKMSDIDKQRGRKGYRELKNMLPFVRRDTSSLWPTEIYTADGHTFDAEVAHPAHGRPFRPEITTVVDVATRKAVGWSAGLAESTWTVSDALRHACINGGIPALFYVDKGAGFTNDVLKNEATGILERLSITPTHSLPYNSQARGIIERSQKTIWVRAAKELPTYMGKDMDPQAKQKAFKLTRRDIKIAGKSDLLLEWEDFLKFCQQQIDNYNNRPHTALPKIRDENFKKRHQTPNEAWAQAVKDGFQPVPVEDWEKDDLFRPYRTCKVSRGEVRLFNNRYFSHDLEDHHDKEVRVGYEIHDASRVWVRDTENNLICIADFESNSRNYYPESFIDQANYKRATGRIKRAEARIEEAKAELDPPQLIEYQPAETLPTIQIKQSPDMAMPEGAMHIEEAFDATNIGVMPTEGAKRPWFITDAEKYRWLMNMHHRGYWTKHDITWLRNFVHTEYYWSMYEIFCREQIKWCDEDEYFANKKLEKIIAEEKKLEEEKNEEDEASATQ